MSGRKILHTVPQDGAYATLRLIAIRIYGGKCEWCSESDTPLQFDHVNGGGDMDRQHNRVNSMIRRIANGGIRLNEPRLQLLCAPCHRSKSALENVHRTMRKRGLVIETPTKAVAVQVVQADARAWIERVIA